MRTGSARARPIPAATALVLMAAVLSCGSEPLVDLPPDVALIVVDTLRNDEMAWAGGNPDAAPNLARLAEEGAAFPKAYAPCSWTRTSVATILTGLDPFRHGVLGHGDRLDESVQTVAEMFSAAGYDTAAVVANPALYDGGTRQGFERFEEVGRWIVHSSDQVGRSARAMVDSASRDRPLFLYVHFLDPHDKYVPLPQDRMFLPSGHDPDDKEVLTGNMRYFEGDIPVREPTAWDFSPTPIPLAPLDLEYMRGLYRGELHAVDREIDLLLDGQRQNRGNGMMTLITSDHGEAFYEHGMYRHGWTLHEEVLRVPMLLHGPLLEGRTIDRGRTARSVDIVPTLLDLTGTGPAEDLDGASLAGPGPEEGVILHGLTRYHVQKASFLITDPYKLIIDERFGRHELYDLEADPLEKRNLAGERPEIVETMLARQDELRKQFLSRRFASGKMEGEELRRHDDAMRALGYVR